MALLRRPRSRAWVFWKSAAFGDHGGLCPVAAADGHGGVTAESGWWISMVLAVMKQQANPVVPPRPAQGLADSAGEVVPVDTWTAAPSPSPRAAKMRPVKG